MPFKHVTCKLGNMRKAQEWVLYPQNEPDFVLIQCENRIARVNLKTGKTILSDGKGGHQGTFKLSPTLGAKEVDLPAEILQELQRLTANAPIGEGVLLVGGK